MFSINERPQICGLGIFANNAAKAGYTNPNGTVNLLEAQTVCKKFGKLVPKAELDEQTLKELEKASKAFMDRNNLNADTFVRK